MHPYWPGVCTNDGDSVTISGTGNLTTTGGEGAAGIGSSWWGSANGTVVIGSGTVNAKGGPCVAGI